jgi:hypothetical protein
MQEIDFELQEAALAADNEDDVTAWFHVERARTIARNYLEGV